MDTKKLKQKVLDLAIRGKLVPQDPNDEPASKLLERIYAEKQKLISEGKIKKEKRTSFIFKGEDNSYYEKVVENGKETIRDITAEIPFDIPETWAWTRLGSVSNYGYVFPVSPENIPDNAWILELEDIEKDSGKILCYVVKRERFAKSSKNQFHTEDILYSKLRPYLNKVVFAEKDGFCSSEILPIKFCKSILPKYAYYYLKTSFFLSYANNSSYGVKMPRLGTETGRNALFPIPPLTEQQKIIKSVNLLLEEVLLIEENFGKLFQQVVLSKSKLLDLAIRGKLLPQNPNDEPAAVLLERIRKEQESTKTKRKSIGSYIFKGEDNLYYEQIGSETKCIQDEIPFDVPNSWAWTRLESIVIINPKNDAEETTEVSFVPMSKIKDGLSNEFSYDIKKWGEVKKGYTHFANGDIGFAKITPCFENKKSVVFTKLKNRIGAGTTELFVLRPYISSVLSDFILAYVKRDAFISDGIKSFNGVVGQQRISSEFVKNSLFPLPPAEEQARICEFLTSAFTKLDSLAQH